jgi:hypothetical protein
MLVIITCVGEYKMCVGDYNMCWWLTYVGYYNELVSITCVGEYNMYAHQHML